VSNIGGLLDQRSATRGAFEGPEAQVARIREAAEALL